MTAALAEFIELEPGQTLRIPVSPGFALRVVEGSVRVMSPPSWLGGMVFNVEATVHTEDVHVVERGGWIEIVALSPAQVQGLLQSQPMIYLNPMFPGRWVQSLTGVLAALHIR
ncbi:hypothetical protein DW355_09115 [Hylemonella gracilis]|jgi:hypothetical protein|uniref:Uncharacterized protein n=1 Tax=Hylemonella gracilis TaxID=80880 RepID=A0A4P6UII9_9BURK|nr:hypothetical protein [Hylemonella gracilis]QBK04912.1 hypothetical protein DW355_09115 [Hylemonella gracilis]